MAEVTEVRVTGDTPRVAVYLVTYRRHTLLRRSLASVLSQTHDNLHLRVVNDDPEDDEVVRIVSGYADPRVTLFEPLVKRGATGSFALAFEEASTDYVAVLEDDNWWQPDFLQSQLKVLECRPEALLVVGNERIWREEPDGTWADTRAAIWPFRDVREHQFTFESICGSAIYCNSSALIRVARDRSLAVPKHIPVDVTEHFRQRTFPDRILLNGAPLTNYSETLTTARDTSGRRWGQYQQLLTGSCFVALKSNVARNELARRLWRGIDDPLSPRAVSLILAGIAINEARALLKQAPIKSLIRGLLTVVRRRGSLARLAPSSPMADALDFLAAAPLTRSLARSAEADFSKAVG